MSKSEALGWENGFRAFHRAKMSSKDTQVNIVGCFFLPKNKLNTLRPYTCAELHAHAYLPHVGTCTSLPHVGTSYVQALTKPTPKSACYLYCYRCYKTAKIYLNTYWTGRGRIGRLERRQKTDRQARIQAVRQTYEQTGRGRPSDGQIGEQAGRKTEN